MSSKVDSPYYYYQNNLKLNMPLGFKSEFSNLNIELLRVHDTMRKYDVLKNEGSDAFDFTFDDGIFKATIQGNVGPD